MERQLLLNGAGVSSDRVTWQATGVVRLAECVHQGGVCTDVLFLPKSKGLFVSSGRGGVNLWTTQRIPKGGGIELLVVVQCCSKNVMVVRTLLVDGGGGRSGGRSSGRGGGVRGGVTEEDKGGEMEEEEGGGGELRIVACAGKQLIHMVVHPLKKQSMSSSYVARHVCFHPNLNLDQTRPPTFQLLQKSGSLQQQPVTAPMKGLKLGGGSIHSPRPPFKAGPDGRSRSGAASPRTNKVILGRSKLMRTTGLDEGDGNEDMSSLTKRMTLEKMKSRKNSDRSKMGEKKMKMKMRKGKEVRGNQVRLEEEKETAMRSQSTAERRESDDTATASLLLEKEVAPWIVMDPALAAFDGTMTGKTTPGEWKLENKKHLTWGNV